MKAKVEIREGFIPGSIERIVEMHASYYAREWQMGDAFRHRVAEALVDFDRRYLPARDLVLIATQDAQVVGSLVLDLHDPSSGDRGAHLRFFILDDVTRGSGIGSKMLQQAMDHVDANCAGRCWLTTFAGLESARHLYEKHGFELTRSETGTRWGYELTDQTFERRR